MPDQLKPENMWVNYNANADSLTVYFNGKPVPSVWDDVDEYALIGFSTEDDNLVTGLKIEHFTTWLLQPDQRERLAEPA